MSKRAEQRGLETLPPRWRKTKDGKGKVDSALPVRKFYIRAYEQAEKDTLEMAVAWLKKNAIDYVCYKGAIGFPGKGDLKLCQCMFDDLKKAMEDEK